MTTVGTNSSVSSSGSQSPHGRGRGRGFFHSPATSNGKPGRKIAANLGSGYDNSAASESSNGVGIHVSGPSFETSTNSGDIPKDVITSQPTSHSGEVSHGSGKRHKHKRKHDTIHV